MGRLGLDYCKKRKFSDLVFMLGSNSESIKNVFVRIRVSSGVYMRYILFL